MNQLQKIAAVGLLGCAPIMQLACSSSTESAVIRYRAENRGPYLTDIAVEHLQGCVEENGDELREGPHHVRAKIQVDSDGRKLDVKVSGVPEDARDFGACVRIALQDMTVPMADLPLRSDPTVDRTNEQTAPTGNEAANPAVWVELAAELAELVAANGGRVVLYTVTIEVLASAGMVGTLVYLKRRQNKTCVDHLKDCLNTATNDLPGNNAGERRCMSCFRQCRGGNWPIKIDLPDGGSCAY